MPDPFDEGELLQSDDLIEVLTAAAAHHHESLRARIAAQRHALTAQRLRARAFKILFPYDDCESPASLGDVIVTPRGAFQLRDVGGDHRVKWELVYLGPVLMAPEELAPRAAGPDPIRSPFLEEEVDFR